LINYFVTSTIGIEDIVASELNELGVTNVSIDTGKVFFKAPLNFMYIGNFMLRTINRLFILLLKERFKDLKDIERLASSIDYSEFIERKSRFAVRAERVGKHEFTSIDVARAVGSGVIKSYMQKLNVRLKVDLENPDIEIYSLVRNNELIIGINTSGESLHKRRYRVYNHPAALKTTLASVLVRLCRYGKGHFLDPTCGGGTIVIEAIHKVRKYPIFLFRHDFPYKRLKIYDEAEEREIEERLLNNIVLGDERAYCIDVSSKHIEGAKVNALSGRVADAVKFVVGDSTIRKTYRGIDMDQVRSIAFNPPYGMRFHNPKKIPIFYKQLLTILKDLFPGSRIALITAAHRSMDSAINEVNIKVLRSFWVMHGGLLAKMYALAT